MDKPKIGIIGCGAIGSEIAKACEGVLKGSLVLGAICDADSHRTTNLNNLLKEKAAVMDIEQLIRGSDIVVEAASASISANILESCIKAGKTCLVMSVGGLVGREVLLEHAESKGVKVFIPSGALCGIDGLKAASMGGVDSVTLTTRKPIKGLVGAPYLKEKNIDIENIKGETVVFEGAALEAVKAFPQNVNVSAVLSLAGMGAAKTRVRIITSPEYTKNTHEVEIRGEFGRITTITENVPSKSNPKTSAMAIFSAIAALKGAVSSVRIGS